MLTSYNGPTLTLVVNPTAGRGRAQRLLPRVATQLLTQIPGAQLRVFQTSSYDEARLRCISTVAHARPRIEGHRPDALLVMGGDGMMHLGLNAAAETDVPVGLIPAGSGNDFCRGLGVPADPLGATKVVVQGRTQRIDLTEAQGPLVGGAERRFVGAVVSTGYDGRVNRRANSVSMNLGPLSYGYAALAETRHWEPLPYRLMIDGHPRSIPAMFVAVGNAGVFGGGMRICPSADVADGLLDITIVHPVSRMTLVRLLPSMYDGTFVKDPCVERLRAREVLVDGEGLYGMADGEELGNVPLRLRAVPRALTVYVP
ncbi:diacylglycerol/lipid kinase family protein [Propionicicella superfundia]|uniref:diacylglycerol/lipid kinase family protein n=1 Tax=Propionicicella superfundia TaxID=348582 RepID=UPI0004045962|nr:diacylglycerol kinase family protein [Propionicicella superfundia]